jgi:lipoprotein-releasing system permease protein
VTRIGDNITSGDLVLSEVPNRDSTRYWPGIVLGKDLAEKLNTTVGDEVTIISLAQQSGLYDLPQMMKFIITGIIKTGFYDLDKNFAYTSLASAQTLLGYHSRVSGIELKLSDYRIADTVVARINNDLRYPLLSESWRGMNPDLFAWVQIQKWAFFLILSLIILVATFNVASTQIMISLKKTREIGILMGMGTTRRRIRRIFTYSGLIIGFFGTLLGCVLGYGICWAQQTYRLLSLPPDVYIVDWLPVVMKSRDFLIVGIVTLFIAYLASIYPAIKASQMTPVKAIRNE